MLVNKLAKRAAVEPHVVRYYTRRALLKPERDPENGYKQFTHRYPMGYLVICLSLSSISHLSHAQSILSLPEAEQLALSTDPLIQGFEKQAQALTERAIADGELADPKLKFGLMNFPTDTFRRDQENMTQLQVGISQAFPKGNTLKHKQAKTTVLAQQKLQLQALQARELIRKIRLSFLEAYYQQHAGEIIDDSRGVFTELVNVTEAHYGLGRQTQQDVLRAQLELSRLDDRDVKIQAEEDAARADLAKWLGQSAYRPLNKQLPSLTAIPEKQALQSQLVKHPLVLAENALVAAKQWDVRLAREQYKPGWKVELTYGERQDRADFLSAMVMMNLPLFTGKRQDRRLAANQQQKMAAESIRDDKLFELRRQLDHQYARWLRLNERYQLYNTRLMPEALQHTEASLSAYQNGISEFNTLMRAQLLELDTRLAVLRIQVDRAKIQAKLLYLIEQPQVSGEQE